MIETMPQRLFWKLEPMGLVDGRTELYGGNLVGLILSWQLIITQKKQNGYFEQWDKDTLKYKRPITAIMRGV